MDSSVNRWTAERRPARKKTSMNELTGVGEGAELVTASLIAAVNETGERRKEPNLGVVAASAPPPRAHPPNSPGPSGK